MKKIKSLIAALAISALATVPAFAGQWEQDQNGFRYKNDDGTYKTGWHQDVDGKWYYLDNTTNCMLTNTITPDGYFVDENGIWIEGGETTTMENVEKAYDNKVELSITAYEYGLPGTRRQSGYAIPATVYYNNKYGNNSQINIVEVATSKDGALCVRMLPDSTHFIRELEHYQFRYYLKYEYEDGTCSEEKEEDARFVHKGKEITCPLPVAVKDKKIASVTIYIDINQDS